MAAGSASRSSSVRQWSIASAQIRRVVEPDRRRTSGSSSGVGKVRRPCPFLPASRSDRKYLPSVDVLDAGDRWVDRKLNMSSAANGPATGSWSVTVSGGTGPLCQPVDRRPRRPGRVTACHHAQMTGPTGADPPPTRWERTVTGDRWDFYVDRFAREYADGTDLEGEARFVDVLAPATGQGAGRAAAAPAGSPRHCTGWATARSGSTGTPGWYESPPTATPGPPFVAADLLALTPDRYRRGRRSDRPSTSSCWPGTCMVYLAPGTERAVLGVLAGLLVPDGRIVAGFATDRDYTVADLDRDADADRADGGAPVRDLASGSVDRTARIGRSPCCGGRTDPAATVD